MYAIELLLVTSWTFLHQYNCAVRDPSSIENVIMARRIVNEVHMKHYNTSGDPHRNDTIKEIDKYLHKNPSAQELMEQDKKDYAAGEQQGIDEAEKLEHLLGAGLVPYMFERCNKSYNFNHLVMYNISLQYEVGNNSLVQYDTNSDKLRVAYMKYQDYVNRMIQWSKKLIKGGMFTLKKVERDTFCNMVYKSNYTNMVNNTRLLNAFENDLQEKVAECCNNVDKYFSPHFEKVIKALIENPIYPKYVPLGRDIQENFIKECNLYNSVRETYWDQLMMHPSNRIYRKTFRSFIAEAANATRQAHLPPVTPMQL